MVDVAILVEGKYVDPKEIDWYVEQVLSEDHILIRELEKLGLSAEKVDWRADKDWSKYKAVIISSVWDYFHRFDEFCQFLDKVKGSTLFVNPISTIQWNMDKHYLADLEKKSISTVPSYFVEKGDDRTLKDIIERQQWSKSVLKPCVSGAARHTYCLDKNNIHEIEPVFRDLIANESMILQPFQHQITTKGEVSHVVINGTYTHSVLKKAKAGDYRVQDDFGGTIHEYEANANEIEFAIETVKACDPIPLYARVDVVWDNKDELALSELELIEPELWFRKNHQAAQLLAEAVRKLL